MDQTARPSGQSDLRSRPVSLRPSKVEIRSDGKAAITLRTVGNVSLERNVNEVIIGDFDKFDHMLTDELFVTVEGDSSVTVICAEWIMSSAKDQDVWEETKRNELLKAVEDLKASLERQEKELLKIIAGQRELIGKARSLALKVGELDEDLNNPPIDPLAELDLCCQESARMHELRSKGWQELREDRRRLISMNSDLMSICSTSSTTANSPKTLLIDRDSQPPKSLRIQYNNPEGIASAQFGFQTLWQGVSGSNYYIWNLASLHARECSVTEIIEIVQETELDLVDCHITFEALPKVYVESMTCLRSQTSRGVIRQLSRSWHLRRLFHIRESENVQRALLLDQLGPKCVRLGMDVRAYIAGKFIGNFKLHLGLSAIGIYSYIPGVLVDNSIAVSVNSDGFWQLTYHHEKENRQIPPLLIGPFTEDGRTAFVDISMLDEDWQGVKIESHGTPFVEDSHSSLLGLRTPCRIIRLEHDRVYTLPFKKP